MNIVIGNCPTDVKFFDDDGREVKIGARSLTIEMEMHQPTRAIVELVNITAENINTGHINYVVGRHQNVRGVIKADGALDYFPGMEPKAVAFNDPAGHPADEACRLKDSQNTCIHSSIKGEVCNKCGFKLKGINDGR